MDGKQTTLDAEGGCLVGKLLLQKLRTLNPCPRAVGGVTMGADPIVTAISVLSYLEGAPLPGFIIRKEPKGHGTGRWIEGLKNLPAQGEVVLVEDVLTTGGTIMEGVEHVLDAGFKVSAVFTIIDRQEGGRERLEAASLSLFSLFTRDELLSD